MGESQAATQLSVVIPFRDEADQIPRACAMISQWDLEGVEVIFVDDGSRDGGASELRRLRPQSTIISLAGVGTGKAFLAGAQKSQGDFILLLPIDCEVSREGIVELSAAINRGVGETFFFPKRYAERAGMTLYAVLQNLVLLRLAGLASWTNGIILARHDTNLLEQVVERNFLADLELSRKLQTRQRHILSYHLGVSPRRYVRDGTWRRIMINGAILFLWFFRLASVERLHAFYRGKSDAK